LLLSRKEGKNLGQRARRRRTTASLSGEVKKESTKKKKEEFILLVGKGKKRSLHSRIIEWKEGRPELLSQTRKKKGHLQQGGPSPLNCEEKCPFRYK